MASKLEQKITVLYKSRWDFKDKSSGEQKKGCKIRYIVLDGMMSSDNKVGYEIQEATFDYDQFSKIKVNAPVVGEFVITGTQLGLINVICN